METAPLSQTDVDGTSASTALSVSDVVNMTKEHLSKLWAKRVWVSGELSDVKQYPSGHVYLTLKDSSAEIRGIMYASEAEKLRRIPASGTAVTLLVKPTIYLAKGRFQLVVHDLRQTGIGELHEKYLQLKDALRKKGWFDDERKRELPWMPEQIAVVVSPHGAAWHDVKKTLATRFPQARISVFAAPAQGNNAHLRIAAAIKAASKSNSQVVLVCRGGGSFEDLFAYCTEEIAAAIHECEIPVITGIGHASDETLADFVADYRAATPTAAAAAAVPDQHRLLKQIDELSDSLNAAVFEQLNEASQRVDDNVFQLRQALREIGYKVRQQCFWSEKQLSNALQEKLSENGRRLSSAQGKLHVHMRLLARSGEHLHSLANRLRSAADASITKAKIHGQGLTKRLNALNPRRTLERGFTLVRKEGKVVETAAAAAMGARNAQIIFADATLDAELGETVEQQDFLNDPAAE